MTWANDKLLGFDLETTSADPLTALPVAFGLAHFDFGKMVKARHGLVDPGIPIPEGATKVHGITDEMVRSRGGDLEKSIFGIAGELLAASIAGIPCVGMNLVYDLTVVDRCLRRIEGELGESESLRDMGWTGPAVDILVLDRHCDRFRKGSRTLLALCTQYGVDPGESHSALADAIASVHVARAIAEKYPEVKHADAELLHNLQVGWRREWAKEFAEYREKKGEPPLEESAGDWPLIGDKPPEPYHVDPE